MSDQYRGIAALALMVGLLVAVREPTYAEQWLHQLHTVVRIGTIDGTPLSGAWS